MNQPKGSEDLAPSPKSPKEDPKLKTEPVLRTIRWTCSCGATMTIGAYECGSMEWRDASEILGFIIQHLHHDGMVKERIE